MNSIAPSAFEPIEYIQDRLYLAAYERNPLAPAPTARSSLVSRSPVKRSRTAAAAASAGKGPVPVYFTVDDTLLYNAFHADFGPLHIGHLYRFAVQFHEILGDPANNDRIVVFWSKPDSRSRANAACLVACYMVLIQSWPPHLALAPLAQADPPYMPFRDAGYSQADYVLGIQDVVYGVWKAKEEGLCGLKDFDLEEYELYERVDMGDFNWITPNFIAFASPQLRPVEPIPEGTSEYNALPSSIADVVASDLPLPMKNVLVHFKERSIGLVVRLNSELYCPTYFKAMGVDHLDMIFEDGTCPPLPLVRRFINIAYDIINNKSQGIAVHCKAGLGRTGCLIGAYLIYRHGFTANEVISFMRFMRPGMVVGPQQHWLHLNQGAFREWRFEDTMKDKLLAQLAATANAVSTPVRATPKASSRLLSNGQMATPPNGKRAALGEIDKNEAAGSSPVTIHDDYLPAPTPGQPRKTHRKVSNHPYARAVSGSLNGTPEELTASARRRKTSAALAYAAAAAAGQASGASPTPRRIPEQSNNSESDEELQLQMLAAQKQRNRYRAASPREPTAARQRPSATPRERPSGSQSAAPVDIHEDVENMDQSKVAGSKHTRGSSSVPADGPWSPAKAPAPSANGNGPVGGTLGVVKTRSHSRRTATGEERNTGRGADGKAVRKISGRRLDSAGSHHNSTAAVSATATARAAAAK